MTIIKKLFKWLVVVPVVFLFTVALLGSIFDDGEPPLTQEERKERYEQKLAEEAKQRSEEIAKLPVIAVTQLARAYSGNEIAANNRYKDKRFVVHGRVSEVTETLTGAPSIRLAGGVNRYMEPMTVLNRDQGNKAARVNAGETIALVCEGNGVTLGRPMLHKCEFVN